MKALLPLLVLLGCLTAAAQDMDTMQGLPKPEPQHVGKSELIAQARTRLMDALLADDQEVAQYQFFYLANGLEDDHYQPLFFPEKVLLACLIGRHDVAMREIARLDSLSQLPPGQYSPRVYPQDSKLWEVVLGQAHARLGQLYDGIARSALTDEEKAVLTLTVKEVMETGEEAAMFHEEDKQEEVNEACDAFLAAHPHSEYEHFVRSFLRIRTKPAWGVGLHWGGGYSAHTGELAGSIPGYGTFSFGLEVSYWRLALEIWGNLGTYRTRDSFLFADQATWPEGTSASPINFSFDLGFRAVDAPRWTLTPFVGYGRLECTPSNATIEDYPDLENHALYKDNALALGLNLDYKVGLQNTAVSTFYWPLRLRVAYYKAFNQPVRGDLFAVTLSIGIYAQYNKRVY